MILEGLRKGVTNRLARAKEQLRIMRDLRRGKKLSIEAWRSGNRENERYDSTDFAVDEETLPFANHAVKKRQRIVVDLYQWLRKLRPKQVLQ